MSEWLRPAEPAEAAAIAALVNRCYRGEASRQGWTTEADLLDGTRTHAEEVLALLQDAASCVLVCLRDGQLCGSVHVQRHGDSAHIGMFVVDPACQGLGLGKRLLAAAEQHAQQRWQVRRLHMLVITLRHELLAYYERRGYRRTGELRAFPVNPALWQPKVADMQLELLEKVLVD